MASGLLEFSIVRWSELPHAGEHRGAALLNAVTHRDYAVPAPIQIRVYADRLLIWNPGELPENWSRARLMGEHPSEPHNPDIANTF